MWKPATPGTNEIPRRRFGPAPEEPAGLPQLSQPSPDQDIQSKLSIDDLTSRKGDSQSDPNAPRQKRSRWGDALHIDSPTSLPTTAISTTGVSQVQLDNYAIHVRLEEINHKLRLNDFMPLQYERSPSPPPTYDGQGRRTNTREVRYRTKLEDERVHLVDHAIKNDPNFRLPVDYQHQKRSQKPSDKVYIPVKEFPEINFFGLLVGPRGNSLKKMERESGAKISIRGKGSVKEGKTRPDQYPDDAEEDLHCLVLADTEEKVATCIRMINRVIETAASTPEGQNDHKRTQLRELAALNGTLRDDENQMCQNCGSSGHRKYECLEQRHFATNIICRVCNTAGHMARDCHVNKEPLAPSDGIINRPGASTSFDNEYAKLLAEFGEHTPDLSKAWNSPSPAIGADVPPSWRRLEHWQANSNNNPQQPQGGGYHLIGGSFFPQQGQKQQQQQWSGYQQAQDYPNYATYYQRHYSQQQQV